MRGSRRAHRRAARRDPLAGAGLTRVSGAAGLRAGAPDLPADRPRLQRALVPQGAAASAGSAPDDRVVLPPARRRRRTGTGSTAGAGCVQYQFVAARPRGRPAGPDAGADLRRRAPLVPRRAQAVRAGQPGAAVVPDAGWTLALDLPAPSGAAPPARRARPRGRGGGWPGLPGQGLPAVAGLCCPDMYPRLARVPRGPATPRPRTASSSPTCPAACTCDPEDDRDQRTRPAAVGAPARGDQRHRRGHRPGPGPRTVPTARHRRRPTRRATRRRRGRARRRSGSTSTAVDFEAEDTDAHPALVAAVGRRSATSTWRWSPSASSATRSRPGRTTRPPSRTPASTTSARSASGSAWPSSVRRQGHGMIVALSSVAGERVRRSNFVYGSTKAGMDGFYLGLGEALRGSRRPRCWSCGPDSCAPR